MIKIIVSLLILNIGILNGQVIANNMFSDDGCGGPSLYAILYAPNICSSSIIMTVNVAKNQLTYSSYNDAACTKLGYKQTYTLDECNENSNYQYFDENYQFPNGSTLAVVFQFPSGCNASAPVPTSFNQYFISGMVSYNNFCEGNTNVTYYGTCNSTFYTYYKYSSAPPLPNSASATALSSSAGGTSGSTSASSSTGSGVTSAGSASGDNFGVGYGSSTSSTYNSHDSSSSQTEPHFCPGYFDSAHSKPFTPPSCDKKGLYTAEFCINY